MVKVERDFPIGRKREILMANVYFGSSVPADQQREMLYRGDLFVLPLSDTSLQRKAALPPRSRSARTRAFSHGPRTT